MVAGRIGFFTVVEDGRTGWTGGLLVLDSSGRPAEFQCTLPVRPTRAHEILFGPTLRSHVIADVIGKLLIEKCRTALALLCCDQPEALGVESYTSVALALVRQAAEGEEGPISDDMLGSAQSVSLAGASLLVPIERITEVRKVAEAYREFPDAVEPFERIREAIKEAHSQLARHVSEAA